MAIPLNDTDVLIVGAGPAGLFLANECARRGLRWRLVEARSSQSAHSKALAIYPRTLEVFDMAGLVAPFLAAANRVTALSIFTSGRKLAGIPFVPEDTPYPFIAMVPQNVTEELLLDALRKKGGDVEYDTRFVSAEQQEIGVKVVLESKGKMTELRSTFVVGCDGAHSVVRKSMGLPFEGEQYEATFLLADVDTNDVLRADELQLCPSELGPLAIFPMSATRRRIVATIDSPEGDAPSLELVQQILARRGPTGFEARSLHWSSYFRIHHRSTPRLRDRWMFIAGDAAHIHSPFGGQGMNTGLQDVWNLVWKLDACLNGHGTNSLLDTYGAERLPVIREVIRMTDFLTRAMGTANRVAQTLRDFVIPIVTRLAPFRHAFVQRLSELGVEYAGSPIIQGRGRRYFDDSMRGGTGIGSRYLLFVHEEIPFSGFMKQLLKDCESTVEVRLSRRSGVTLVRPDGHIAFQGKGDSAMESAGTFLERRILQRIDSARMMREAERSCAPI